MSAAPDALVIGFPSALASRLAGQLARSGRRVRLLCPPHAVRERERLARDLDCLEGSTDRIDFGLAGGPYLELADEVAEVYVAELPAPPGDEPPPVRGRRVAREVVELALAARKLRHLLVLSHVDVAGTFFGRFAERDLEVGQRFGDAGQEERYRAERVYRRFAGDLPITVARAGWVLGTAPGAGICPLPQLLLAAGDEIGKAADRRLALTDLDGLVTALAGLAEHPPVGGGRVLHLLDPAAPEVAQLHERVTRTAGELVPGGFDLATGARRALRESAERGAWSAGLPGAPGREGRWSTREGRGSPRDWRRWSPRDFFRRQPARARFETAFTRGVVDRLGLPIGAVEDERFEQLIEHAVEQIVGFR